MVEWRAVVGWEGLYEVSNDGQVRSIDRAERRSDGAVERRKGRLLAQTAKGSEGYQRVHLRDMRRGRRLVVNVHRLVASAFIPNPDGKPYINHIDCNPANNGVTNLEWCTQAENLAHARRLGRMPDDHWKGKRSPSAGLSDETAATIRAEYATGGYSHESLGKKHGVSKSTVGKIVRGKSYV